MSTKTIHVKRIYGHPGKEDGYRILVDRVWPRGIAKEAAALDLWLRDVAPSTALRKWFGHKPERWTEFKQRYYRELQGEAGSRALKELHSVKSKVITLLFAAKDMEHNNAVALREYLT